MNEYRWETENLWTALAPSWKGRHTGESDLSELSTHIKTKDGICIYVYVCVFEGEKEKKKKKDE